jgi:hypothetical protein
MPGPHAARIDDFFHCPRESGDPGQPLRRSPLDSRLRGNDDFTEEALKR